MKWTNGLPWTNRKYEIEFFYTLDIHDPVLSPDVNKVYWCAKKILGTLSFEFSSLTLQREFVMFLIWIHKDPASFWYFCTTFDSFNMISLHNRLILYSWNIIVDTFFLVIRPQEKSWILKFISTELFVNIQNSQII